MLGLAHAKEFIARSVHLAKLAENLDFEKTGRDGGAEVGDGLQLWRVSMGETIRET